MQDFITNPFDCCVTSNTDRQTRSIVLVLFLPLLCPFNLHLPGVPFCDRPAASPGTTMLTIFFQQAPKLIWPEKALLKRINAVNIAAG
jgi:hypothetical protein